MGIATSQDRTQVRIVPDGIAVAQVRAAHAALLRPIRPGLDAPPRPIDDLLCFYQFDRWTVRALAERWWDTAAMAPQERRTAEAMVRRDLQRLQRIGVIDCLEGKSRATRAPEHATGREGDLFYLNALGAQVLIRHLRLGRNALKAPRVALDRGRARRNGLVKYRRASATAWDAHLFACQRLAVYHRWLDDERWRFMRMLPDTITLQGWERDRDTRLIPDAWLWDDDRLFAIEVEGTAQLAHIKEKHAKYAALAGLLGSRDQRLQLTVVFVSAQFRRQVLRHHEVAYSRLDGGYGFAWLDLETALAVERGAGFWAARQFVDRQSIRERQRVYHEREMDAFRGW